MNFDVEKITAEVVAWIRQFFDKNGNDCNAIIGVSGGKDSSVAAALCVKALGKDRVIGLIMPNYKQSDLSDACDLANHLGIQYHIVDIGEAVDDILEELLIQTGVKLSEQTITNIPPRIRMSTLYAFSQSMNGRVVNTCNLSEDWVGYSTRYGDSVGDFSPLSNLTATEVVEIGKYLGLPKHLVEKVPSDGLCGKTDEDNLGFTYSELDSYIRDGIKGDNADKIDAMHYKNLFKLQLMPSYQPNLPIIADSDFSYECHCL